MPPDPTSTPDPAAVAPTPQLPPQLALALAKTDFGPILTSPLFSRVIQSSLGMLVMFVGTKVFKLQEADIHVQDYVELLIVILGSILAIVYRIKSQGSIQDPVAAAKELLPLLQQAVTPQVRQDLMKLVQQKNPKVYEALQLML